MFGYKHFLKNKADRNDAVIYGAGHATLECIFATVQIGAYYLVYGNMISAGSFNSLIDQANSAGNTMLAESYSAMTEQIAAFTLSSALLLLRLTIVCTARNSYFIILRQTYAVSQYFERIA